MKPNRIASVYVVDSSVALLGGVPLELLEGHELNMGIASSAFLSRAAFHGAELHVPFVFLSEVGSGVYQGLIASKRTTFEDGQRVREAIFGTTWEYHVPVWDDVFEIQRTLGRAGNTNVAEFLSLALNLGCAFITTDKALVQKVARSGLEIEVHLVTAHLWGTPGALDMHPPTD